MSLAATEQGAMRLDMTDDAGVTLKRIIDFCFDKWSEADRNPGLTADVKTGRKTAYNDVLQHARKLLTETAEG
jgi:hypothetical protein